MSALKGARSALFAGVALAALAGPALAASPSDGSTKVEEVIVTANKRDERQREVAMAVTALSGQALQDRNLHSFADYAALVPGLSLQQGPSSQNRLIIRGLNSSGAGSTVAVYIDDTPVGASNSLSEGGLYSANSDTFDMQRVEILRGPQGTLYGANATGGLIKYVTKAPRLGVTSFGAEATYEGVDGGGRAGAIRAVANLPLGDRAAFRIVGFSQQIPGYVDDLQHKKEDVNEGKREGARASVYVEPSDTFNVRLTGFFQKIDTDAAGFIDVVGAPASYAQPPANRFSPFERDLSNRRRALTPSSDEFFNIEGKVNWDLGFATLTSITSYQGSEQQRRRDQSNSIAALIPPVSPQAPYGVPFTYANYFEAFVYGYPVDGVQEEHFTFRKTTQEFRLASPKSDRFDWQVGAYLTRETSHGFYDLFAEKVVGGVSTGERIASPPFGDNVLDYVYKEWALFGQATYHFSPRFDVAVGLRYARNDQRDLYINHPGVFTGPLLVQRQTSGEGAWTYSVAPRFKISEDTLLYARVASGYRPGAPQVVPPTAPANFPKSYNADFTTNYEIGFRTQAFDRRLSADLAVFRIDWRDIQIPVKIPGYTVVGNGGTARSQGVEWSFGLRPVEGLSLMLNGAFIDATLTEDALALGGAKSGDWLAYVPQWTNSLDGQYEWTLGPGRAFVGGTLAYVGERRQDHGATPGYNGYVLLPSYTTLNGRAGLDWKQYRLEVYGYNLADERGVTLYSNTAGGASTVTGFKTVIQPRTIGVRLTANF